MSEVSVFGMNSMLRARREDAQPVQQRATTQPNDSAAEPARADAASYAAQIARIIDVCDEVVVGKRDAITLSLACLLARGHLLLEDLPGVGKTTLAQVLARVLGLEFARVQFTSDLLPADVVGASIYQRDTGGFEFHPGPVFTQVLLADEVNRASPKTQSALLEAMEERQVTVDGHTRLLPEPFFVIATQNPLHQTGTFALPESQLDRFLVRLELGYPGRAAERELLAGRDRREMAAEIRPACDADGVLAMQRCIPRVKLSEALLDYVQALLEYTRAHPTYPVGLSPRAGLALARCAQAWAFIAGRDFAVPEDVQAVLTGVVPHRLGYQSDFEAPPADRIGEELLASVPVP